MNSIDDYIQDVIQVGDDGSKLLATHAAPTLHNSSFVDVVSNGMHGTSVLRIPNDQCVVVHSAGGNVHEKDLHHYARSVVEHLVAHAKQIGAQPLAFADVIDSESGDLGMLTEIMNGLVDGATTYKLAIMNGENAILGSRVQSVANVSGTMISIAPRNKLNGQTTIFDVNGVRYAAFDHENLPVSINSDGVGTKTEFGERSQQYEAHLADSIAMKADDTIKKGAHARVIADVVETRGAIPFDALQTRANTYILEHGIAYILQHEPVGNRIQSYRPDIPAYNISGSLVSVIDENFIHNPPTPHAGETLVAIAGKPNPRSNGISAKRKIMTEQFGSEWHTTEQGKSFLEYLAAPSTVLYFAFRELLDKGLATSVYHMSGGAYNGKLAQPLAKHGLSATLDTLFTPDDREIFFVDASGTSLKDAYTKWPMGNDGFVTSAKPEQTIEVLHRLGYRAQIAGRVTPASQEAPVLNVRTYTGETISFP